MGKEIVRQESPKEPGKRSRLWFHEDIVQVLEKDSGTSQIESIYLDFPLFEEEVVEWKGDEFQKMKSLKKLIIKSGRFSKGPDHLPNSLRVLEWRRYPSQDIPSSLCPKKLSICNLHESCLTSFELSNSLKMFVNMRDLNLDRCQCLTKILDISGLPNLEKNSFQKCENLITIHYSLGFLKKLKILNAEGCSKLRSFPPLELTSLQKLELSYCHSLGSFPEILGKMENITDIVLAGTSIEEFPFSFQNLSGLCMLQLDSRCGMLRLPSSIVMMPKLSEIIAVGYHLLPKQNDKLSSMVPSNIEFLRLSKCNLLDEFFPMGFTWFANVKELDLSGSNFTILPECLKESRFLRSLHLNYCKYLQQIREIPPNLKHLSALCCKSLTSSCRSMLLNQELHEVGGTKFCLPGSAMIPEWFEHQSRRPSISFWFRNKLPSIALFFVCESMHNPYNEFLLLEPNMIINGYKSVPNDLNGFGIYLKIRSNHTYLYDVQLQNRGLQNKLDEALSKNEWIHVEFTFEDFTRIPCRIGSGILAPRCSILESGIHVFKQKSSMEDIQFTNPYKKRKLDDDDHYS